MICQDCKERVATVIFTEVRGGTKKVLHLCQTCVEKRGIPTPVLKNPLQVDLVFKDLLEQLSEEEEFPGRINTLDSNACRSCGWTFANFRETGLLGCPRCYRSFNEILRELLLRVHGSDEHLGKLYEDSEKAFDYEEDIESLKEALEDAIHQEEFELAAEIRDRLHRVKEQDD